jgi:hypothetical protein
VSTVQGKFLDPARINSALKEVAAETKRDGLRVALVGGVALQLYGSPRLTTDLDVAADGYPNPAGALPTHGVLSFGGIKTSASNGVPVDLIVRDDQRTSLYDDAINNARRFSGVPVPVATLPYLGAMKLAAGRSKDLQDLNFMLTDTDVSYKKLRAVVTKYLGEFDADELDNLKRAIVWQRGKKL